MKEVVIRQPLFCLETVKEVIEIPKKMTIFYDYFTVN